MYANSPDAPEKTGPEGVHADVVDAVADRLQRTYQDIVNEPVPDHLLDFLKKLDDQGHDGQETSEGES